MLAEFDWSSIPYFWVCVFAVPIVAILVEGWYKVERIRTEADLKRSMIERGMSVEEIERVISAKSPKQ